MQCYARDMGFDVRNFDVIINFAGSLRKARNVHAAMLARGCHHVALVPRVRMQRPVCPRMRLTLGLFRHHSRGLAPMAWWNAGVTGRLRRRIELGFEFGDARAKNP